MSRSISPTRFVPRATAAAMLVGVALPARAVITRHDVPDASYVVPDADYPALVDLFEPDDCMGTLVEGSHLLTVAHCATDLQVGHALDVAGAPHTVAEVFLHPQWNDGDHYDIAVVRLSTPVTHVEPLPIYTGNGELGQTVWLVGRGTSGTALQGESGGSNDAQLRRATNTVSFVNDFLIELRMDSPTDADVTALEGVGAGGDSGCPVFMDVNGVPHIVGLNAFGDTDGGGDIGSYGAWDYQTRVTLYETWLEGIIGPIPVPSVDPDTDDEPDRDAGADVDPGDDAEDWEAPAGDTGVETDKPVGPSDDTDPGRLGEFHAVGCSMTGGGTQVTGWGLVFVALTGLMRRRAD